MNKSNDTLSTEQYDDIDVDSLPSSLYNTEYDEPIIITLNKPTELHPLLEPLLDDDFCNN